MIKSPLLRCVTEEKLKINWNYISNGLHSYKKIITYVIFQQ